MPFTCTICEEESTRICIACTKDTCGNHLCEKCRRCSDCCDCELRLDVSEDAPAEPLHYYAVEGEDDDPEDEDDDYPEEDDPDEARPVAVAELADGPREPEPHPHPLPDPDPAPEPNPMPIPGFPGPEENN
jgi:hypothetical protein